MHGASPIIRALRSRATVSEAFAQRFGTGTRARDGPTVGVTLLAGQPYALDARPAARVSDIAMRRSTPAEIRRRQERFDRQRGDRLSGIRGLPASLTKSTTRDDAHD